MAGLLLGVVVSAVVLRFPPSAVPPPAPAPVQPVPNPPPVVIEPPSIGDVTTGTDPAAKKAQPPAGTIQFQQENGQWKLHVK